MVKVVIPLAKGEQCRNEMISRRMSIVKRSLAEPMGQRVDAKGSVVDCKHPHDERIDETAFPVAPQETRDGGGDDDAGEELEEGNVFMLPFYNGVLRMSEMKERVLAVRTFLKSRISTLPTDVFALFHTIHPTCAWRNPLFTLYGSSSVSVYR